MSTTKQDSATTQNFLDIYDITNDMIILKNGTVSVVVAVDAMNFGLLAEEEQDSIMYAYAGLLNSLNYPIQIVIKSQTKDVTSYLKILEKQENEAKLRVNQKRIRRYREFVSNLIQERNVLDKKFYISIPATPLELGLLSAQSVLPGSSQFSIDSVEKNIIIEKGVNLLGPKLEHIIGQFARIGLYARQLNTQEIIQLFYANYNPEAVEGQRLADTHQYTTPLVQASIENIPMQNVTNNPGVAPTQTPQANQPQPPVQQIAPEQQSASPLQPAPEQAPVVPVQNVAAQPVMQQDTQVAGQDPQTVSAPPLTSPIPPQQTPIQPVQPVSPVPPMSPTSPVSPAMNQPSPGTPVTPEVDLQAEINQQVNDLGTTPT